MAVLPLAQKVDDFLLKISELSQQRLRENQQRQLDLELEIDSLRLSKSRSPATPNHRSAAFSRSAASDINQLTFNRTARSRIHETWKDEAPPPKPRRPQQEDAPRLPRRPEEILPALPKRPMKPEKPALLHSTSETPAMKPTKPDSFDASSSLKEVGKPKYSTEPLPKLRLETVRQEAQINLIRPVARPADNKESQTVLPNYIPRYEKPSPRPQSYSTFGELERKIKGTEPSSAKPPLKPAKPSFQKYQQEDMKELLEQKSRLSPAKARDKVPHTGLPAPKESYISSRQSISPNPAPLKPVKPLKPKDLAQEAEALSALEKLRKCKPKDSQPQELPEAMQKLRALKDQKAESKIKPVKPLKPASRAVSAHKVDPKAATPLYQSEKSSPTNVKELNGFQEKLASILRAQTEPTMAKSPAMGLAVNLTRRVNSETKIETSAKAEKLTHPNKARAKGPKRKLPKSMNKSGLSSNSSAGKSEAIVPSTLAQTVKTKKVPPLKAKKPNFEVKPSRNFSGEIFI